MKLRPYQEEARRAIESEWHEGTAKTLLVLPTGCHATGQRLLLADGSTKAVEYISYQDMLMGDDGKPRHILHITHGIGDLYKVVPVKGKAFIVTGDHKLTLRHTNETCSPKYPSERHGGEIVDVSVSEWLTWSKWKKHIHKIIRSSAIDDFGNHTETTVDPYFLGILLGDGSLVNGVVSVTTQDSEVVEEIDRQCEKYGLEYRIEPAGKANTYIFRNRQKWQHSQFKKDLKALGVLNHNAGSKFVPQAYKTASIAIRKEIIAGLIDSDGSLTMNGFDFISKSKALSCDLAYMCRSIGLAAYVKKCQKSCNDYTGTYYRVSISGDCSNIPTRVAHKQAAPRRQKKNVLVTGFSIEPCGRGDYVGFTVDGDNRYLLDDFTITHNCGKTICFSAVAADRVEQGDRVLIMAHRGELLEQAADKLKAATGLASALEKAESSCLDNPFARVVVGSVQTLMRESRLERFPHDYFRTIIIDEAHHAVSQSYQNVLSYFDGARVLGVTATADRADMKDLGSVFDSLAYEYTLPHAIKDGYLSPIKAQTIPLKLDISKVAMSAGDFKASDIDDALEPYLESIADEMRNYCKGRRTVVFLPLVATSQKFRDILNERGFKAAEVNGESKDRAEILRDFAAGKYDVLCNSMLLTEGWDCPAVDCVVVLRPTKSRALYSQMVGRGTRLSPGKKELLLLDFLWMTERHELCRPAHLLAKDKDVAAAMTKRIEESAEPQDLEDVERQANEDVVREREESLAKQLAQMKKRKRKLVDPLQFEMSIQAEDLTNYVPAFGWELNPVSEKQKATLERSGIFPDEITCAGKAQQVIDRLAKRRAAGLTTPKQIRFLESRGFTHVGTWSFEAASNMIARISANGWRTPHGVTPSTYKPEV